MSFTSDIYLLQLDALVIYSILSTGAQPGPYKHPCVSQISCSNTTNLLHVDELQLSH